MKRRPTIAGVVVAVVIAATWLSFAWQTHRTRYDYTGTVETREIQIGSRIGGRVTAVPVEEGGVVAAGVTLVRFECDELKAQRVQAEASLEQARADLDKMLHGNRPEEITQAEATAHAQLAAWEAARNGPRRQEINQAQADYSAASADATNAEVTYERMEKLIAADTISRQQFDDAHAKRDAAAQRAESARQRLALLQAGTRVETSMPLKRNSNRRKPQQRSRGKDFAKKTLTQPGVGSPKHRVVWLNWTPACGRPS